MNTDGTPDLVTVSGAGVATIHLVTGITTTPTITAQAGQALITSTHTWPLNDGTATTATDTTGGAPLTISGGVAQNAVWHTGDLYDPDVLLNTDSTGTAVDSTGTGRLTSTTPLVDTTKSFSISVWVKPTGAGGVIASEDGAHSSRFMLWDEVSDNTWHFGMATADTTAWSYDMAIAPAGAQLGVWTHLVATYNASTNTMSLYVNNLLADTTYHKVAATWPATGSFVVGRYLTNNAPSAYYSGQVANVQTWNSALTAIQVGATNTQHALSGQWRFDTTTGVTTDSSGNGHTLTLNPPNQTGTTGKYNQGLTLTGGYATTSKVVNTTAGYTICAWAKLDNVDLRYHAIFSQDANRSSGLWLRTNASSQWEFVIATSDTTYLVAAGPTAAANAWTHVCGVWDANTSQMMLFVNGALAAIQTAATVVVPTGQANIGRYKYLDAYTGAFPGTLDDVRTYVGAITDTDQLAAIGAAQIDNANSTHALSGQWKFDATTGPTTDSSGNGHTLTLIGAVQTGTPGKTSEGLTLAGGYATTSHTIDTNAGYTICAWANPTGSDLRYRTIFSQDANRSSGLWLRINSISQWEFVIGISDSSYLVASGPTAQADRWTHVCGSWDNTNKRMILFIDGKLGASSSALTGGNATGGVNLGRYKYLDNYTGGFGGTIDDVRTYVGPITTEDQITNIMTSQ